MGANLLEGQSPEALARLDAAMAAIPYPEGILWRATGPDGTELTLVGTLHVPDPRHQKTVDAVAPVLDSAAMLVVEADEGDQDELQRRLAEQPDLAFITEGPSLLEQMPPEDWAALRRAMEARGLPGFFVAKFQPWYAGLVLSIPPCAAAEMQAMQQGLDMLLMDEARARAVPVRTLDDLDALITTLTAGSPDEQLADLLLAIRFEWLSEDILTTMTDLYFEGRHRASWEFWRYIDLIGDGGALDLSEGEIELLESRVAAQEQTLLDDRNLAWIGKLIDMTRGQRAVVAVGAGHLSGETGLLNQLALRGFTLIRLDL